MAERRVSIGSAVGLHARPAAAFVKAAASFGLPVTIAKPGRDPVNAASILSVLGLGADHGDEVVIAAVGDGAEDALDRLADLLAAELDPSREA